MKILLDKNNVVIQKGDVTDLGNQNFKVKGVLYPRHLDLHLVDLELDPTPQVHKIENELIIDNPNYVEPINKDQVIADMTALLIEGGLL